MSQPALDSDDDVSTLMALRAAALAQIASIDRLLQKRGAPAVYYDVKSADPSMPADVWISVAVAARRANKTPECIRQWLKKKLVAHRLNGSNYEIDPGSLRKYIARES